MKQFKKLNPTRKHRAFLKQFKHLYKRDFDPNTFDWNGISYVLPYYFAIYICYWFDYTKYNFDRWSGDLMNPVFRKEFSKWFWNS